MQVGNDEVVASTLAEDSVVKKMFIFMNAGAILTPKGFISADGSMCAGIFEIEIGISRNTEGKPIVQAPAENEIFKPIATLFKQRDSPVIASAGACVIGSELYMFPDEGVHDITASPVSDTRRIQPCKFNLTDKSLYHVPNFPLARNITPLVVAIRDQVHALSFRDLKSNSPPDPCFELLNPNDKSYEWSPLPCSPFHKEELYQLSGHAVLGESFILVCLKRLAREDYLLYSYSIQTGNWKTVGLDPNSFYPILRGESVVIGNDIYTYYHYPPGKLIVCSYTHISKDDAAANTENDISLGSVREVKGLEHDKEHVARTVARRMGIRFRCLGSSSLGKIEERILCVVDILHVDEDWRLNVCVSVFQIEEPERCTTLKIFRCRLELGDQLSDPILKSCFVL